MTRASTTARTLADLVAAGVLPPTAAGDPALAQVARDYAIAVTPDLLDLIEGAPAGDPIARQFIPTAQEATTTSDELTDPIGDHTFAPVRGIVHRYPDRVLLKPLHACPVYCRFCFRREQVGPGGDMLDDAGLEAALDYIATHPDVWEVVVTGGDPFMLSPRRIARIVAALDATAHVAVIRFHTRVPVVEPARVSDALVAALKTTRAAVYVGVHCNHARELTSAARTSLATLADAGIPLLSQSVLLRGVNDSVEALEALFRALVAARVRPYYLHHPDLARGTSHFRLSIDEGQALMRALRGRLSGLCQPTYVLDIPGGYGKSPIGPTYVGDPASDGQRTIEDFRGDRHDYPAR
ncbi:lysine-2,3-aminomutase-like protein [Reyranella sp. CPCC 100927]|uniref:lysine-2,3-aminomutase-like protein n=1 Tax=Reyranella sp. CPCC 100927 TaxID=2599616 RepID=UPI0011B6372C|nr:lysine-2,3-aminomutase-like protein [Reyranella sp. CPCC 100927]TWT02614.1 lysine-2,3-aminomutase-like protein [Reyranella sp. CPCC 100927]